MKVLDAVRNPPKSAHRALRGVYLDLVRQVEHVISLRCVLCPPYGACSAHSGVACRVAVRRRAPLICVRRRLDHVGQLCLACSGGDIVAIQRLIASGVSASGVDYDGRAALHVAAAKGQAAAVRYLLDHAAYCNPLDSFNNTPLYEACPRPNPPPLCEPRVRQPFYTGGVSGPQCCGGDAVRCWRDSGLVLRGTN